MQLMKQSIEKLIQRKDLSVADCEIIFTAILNGEISPLQTAAFLVLLSAKSETAEEITAILHCLQKNMQPLITTQQVLDIVGTGGDGFNTVNISTGSAILAASCGVKIAKHGNRSASSLSGSADILEALGLNIHLSPEKISEGINSIGIGFCFAPSFHPLLQQLKQFRKELNVPTIFNLLGPFLNPAKAKHLILGVANEKLLTKMADVLAKMHTTKSFIVHGCGLDEISCLGIANVIEVTATEKNSTTIDPVDFGFSYCQLADLQGGDAQENARLLMNVFSGAKNPLADSLILNASVALYIYGLSPTIAAAIPIVKEKLYSGATLNLLKQWIEFTHA